MKDDLHPHETSGPRFDLALQRLHDGFAFILDRVSFRLQEDGRLECAVHSSWLPENITTQRAFDDFAHAKEVVRLVSASSVEFATLIAAHPVDYAIIEDYGIGSVILCRLDGESIRWAAGIRKED